MFTRQKGYDLRVASRLAWMMEAKNDLDKPRHRQGGRNVDAGEKYAAVSVRLTRTQHIAKIFDFYDGMRYIANPALGPDHNPSRATRLLRKPSTMFRTQNHFLSSAFSMKVRPSTALWPRGPKNTSQHGVGKRDDSGHARALRQAPRSTNRRAYRTGGKPEKYRNRCSSTRGDESGSSGRARTGSGKKRKKQERQRGEPGAKIPVSYLGTSFAILFPAPTANAPGGAIPANSKIQNNW